MPHPDERLGLWWRFSPLWTSVFQDGQFKNTSVTLLKIESLELYYSMVCVGGHNVAADMLQTSLD